jgi:phosphatidylinositol alpha-1,6-mannosyltransferase
MNLSIFAYDFPPSVGGMEQHALGLARELAKTDDVTVYTARRHEGHVYREDFAVLPVLTGNPRRDLGQISESRIDTILALNAGYSVLALHTRVPVFCYCHGNDFLEPWVRSAGRIGTPIVRGLRGTPFFWRYARPIHVRQTRAAIQRALNATTGLFANSTFTRQRLAQAYPNLRVPIHVSPPGVSETFFEKEEQNRIPRSKDNILRILSIARLSEHAERKNIGGTLEALAKLKDNIPLHYTIVGDGERREHYESRARNLGLADAVSFPGSLTTQDLIAELDATDILVMAARKTDRSVEGFGIVYAEAAARGVPSLMSRDGGATDAVKDGVSGKIIEASTPDAIAAGIRDMHARSEAFDPAAIRAFAETFRWSRVGARMRDVIQGNLDQVAA